MTIVMKDKIRVELGDIIKYKLSAIVNAANSRLAGGGGVDGAIHRGAGQKMDIECNKIISEIKQCKPGNCVLTNAYNLDSEFVIHTVGPIYGNGTNNEKETLYNAYFNCLVLAKEKEFETIAFPNISTGVYKYPKIEACEIAFSAVIDFIKINSKPELVYFVCYEQNNYEIYKNYFDKYLK